MKQCPSCKSSWVGDKIPEESRHLYASDYFGREIGIDGGFMGIYDGIVAIACPDCGEQFPKNDSEWAKELFNKFTESKKKFVASTVNIKVTNEQFDELTSMISNDFVREKVLESRQRFIKLKEDEIRGKMDEYMIKTSSAKKL